MDIPALQKKLDEAKYICSGDVAATLLVALQLGRPLLIEGPAGVGKTEIAKVMASALDRELGRLQCYEGLDESKALYEWNYQKQLLNIQIQMDRRDADELTKSLFGDAGAAPAACHPLRGTGGAAHRRNRQGRRGVRGVFAGAAQ